jgi:high-affinity iron transporter
LKDLSASGTFTKVRFEKSEAPSLLASAVITLREGLEAALIVGILLGYLRKTGRPRLSVYVWAGVLAAAMLSVGLAISIQSIGFELEGRPEMLFEAGTMFLAVVILTYMIFWMRYQARTLRSSLEQDIDLRLRDGQTWGIASLAFIAVFREGVETALFLSAIVLDHSASTLGGAAVGLLIAVAAGYVLYTSAARLNLRLFFTLTSVVLLAFAAGLVTSGLHELQEAGLLPILESTLWNTSSLLPDGSTLGQLLNAVVGYRSQPSLLEVVGYLSYWAAAIFGVRGLVDWKVSRSTSPATSAESGSM